MKLFYRKYGEGKPVIILHGLFGMSDNWISIAKKISPEYEVLIPDLRNHGQSPHSDEFDYDLMCNDLLEFMNLNTLKSTVLIGHSMGGNIAMKFALEYEEMVDKLIVVDIKPTPYTGNLIHSDLIKAMQSVDFNIAGSYADIDKQLSQNIQSVPLRQFFLKNIYRTHENKFSWKLNLESIEMNLGKLHKGIENGNQFTKPTLFIRGGLSDYIKDEDFDDIKTIFPKSEIQTIPQASHWVHADAPERFVSLVNDFLIRH